MRPVVKRSKNPRVLGRKRAKTREEGKMETGKELWPKNKKTLEKSRVLKSGGGGWIRTIELIEVRFTV